MIPAKFAERMQDILGGEGFSRYLDALSEPPVRAFLLDTERISEKVLGITDGFTRGKVPFADNAYYFSLDRIGDSPLFLSGAIYVQEPFAMAPVAAAVFPDDAVILDMCAAPGGKSVQAARKAKNGVVVSNEFSPARAKVLLQNIERCGIKNSVVTNLDATSLSGVFPEGAFDAVICDAPCSGEGMMRKDPAAASEWSEGMVAKCAAIQKKLLDEAALMCADGGVIIYSTCTFSLEENEMQIDSFLSSHRDFRAEKQNEIILRESLPGIAFGGAENPDSLALCRRFYPHISRGEGQFSAILRKDGERKTHSFRQRKKNPPKGADAALIKEFLLDTAGIADLDISLEKDGIYIVPDAPIPERGVLSAGVKAGVIEKGRIVPHHRYFTAFGREFLRQTELFGSPFLEKYLAGETFPTDSENGWNCMTYLSCPLGGGKAVAGQMKNFYPKGLRKR